MVDAIEGSVFIYFIILTTLLCLFQLIVLECLSTGDWVGWVCSTHRELLRECKIVVENLGEGKLHRTSRDI
jgi:hypothetical protein